MSSEKVTLCGLTVVIVSMLVGCCVGAFHLATADEEASQMIAKNMLSNPYVMLAGENQIHTEK